MLKHKNAYMVNDQNVATKQDYILLDEITKLRAENPDYQATFEHLRAIDRILIDQARERLKNKNSEICNK